MDAQVEHFHRDGYAIVRALFTAADIAELARAFDQIHAEARALGRSFRYGNLNYRLEGDQVRMAQWPSYHNPVLDAVRCDARIGAVLAPLIGPDIKQIINQLHWKAPGGRGDFAYHQDSRFRRPESAYRNLGDSYVQTGIAVDTHSAKSGAMRILPGSHAHGKVDLAVDGPVTDIAPQDAALAAAGLDPARLIDLVLDPGDFVVWSPYLVHGSGTNSSDHYRRFYINGYVRAADCDRGEWAFRQGRPQPFGVRTELVHFEELYERPGPHFA